MADFKCNQLQLRAGVINRIEDGKLKLLVTRLAQHLVTLTCEKPFTEEELSKLEASLGMNRKDVNNVVCAILELLTESAYSNIAPNVLESHLIPFELEKSKIAVFVAVWEKAMDPISDALRNKAVLPQISHLAYNISVEAGSDLVANERNTRAHIQLGVKSDLHCETLDLEFGHDELFDLHSQLTRIQAQLDAIGNK